MKDNTVSLDIIDWFVGGGEHLTGELCYYDVNGKFQLEKLTYKLTESQAIKLNKKDSVGRSRHRIGGSQVFFL